MRALGTALIGLITSWTTLRAQVATSYLERYRELAGLRPTGQVADVRHLVLERDAGRLALEQGRLYLLSGVGGRTVGAVFEGSGRLTFAPSLAAEQEEVRRLANAPSLDDDITAAVIVFADSTLDQLRTVTFAAGETPGSVGDRVTNAIGSLAGDKDGAFNAGILRPLLNGATSGLFVAILERAHGEALRFEIDPSLSEPVRLFHRTHPTLTGSEWSLVSQFPLHRPLPGSTAMWSYRDRLRASAYRIETDLPLAGSGGVRFAAAATVTLRATEAVGPWLPFALEPKLRLDSARWGGGEDAAAFKAQDDATLWVRAPRVLAPGDSARLVVWYHGDLVDRYADWFFLDPSADWYPVSQDGPRLATFDLTFHSPASYPLVSIGERVSSSTTDRVTTSRWVSRRPTDFATFTLGTYDATHLVHPGSPTLDILLSERAHGALRLEAARLGGYLPQQRNMSAAIEADVSNSIRTFTYLFGSSPFDHYYVAEIPYGEGVSFPGMIDLSWATFQTTEPDGFDEYFRAHEVAHQWWGNGVRQASYRDKWLSEGLATFSGLWYLQLERHHYDEYFHFLDQYQADIRDDHELTGSVWVGFRAASPRAPSGYHVMVYEKGAWIFHMLRAMMLDLHTMSDQRFTDMLQDYYTSFLGRAATTEDFRQVVERDIGSDMGWFFDEWVRGTAIPTYHVAWTSEPLGDGRFRVRLRVSQEHVPDGFRMPVLVAADLGDNRLAHFRVDVHGASGEYTSPPIPGEVKGITFNEYHSVLADVRMERWSAR